MRVLFLESSPIWVHTLPAGFRELGHEVKISGPLSEDNLLPMIKTFAPQLIIYIGWGPEQTVKKQYLIRKKVKPLKIPLVYWSVEDPAYTEIFTLPLVERVAPDFVFTICQSTVALLKKRGIRAARLDFAYSPEIHFPTRKEAEYQCSLAVVANGYPQIMQKYPDHYRNQSLRTLVHPLLKAGVRIDFWGLGWEEMGRQLDCQIPADYLHGYLPYLEANKVYSSAEIVLGIQNYPNQLNQRIYEILGSGGFLLTSDTQAVRNLFTPGQGLIVSASPAETLELVQYYLQHPAEREKVRQNGVTNVTCETYQHRVAYLLQILHQERLVK